MSTTDIITRILQICGATFWVIVYFGTPIITKRQERARAERGYWVEYLSSNTLRSDPEDFGLAYHQGDQWRIFTDKRTKDVGEILHLPDEEEWRTEMPEWLRGQRGIVVRRLQADAPSYVTVVDGPASSPVG